MHNRGPGREPGNCLSPSCTRAVYRHAHDAWCQGISTNSQRHSPHRHMLYLNGVYDARGYFWPVAPPTREELGVLAHTIAQRIARHLERAGYLVRDPERDYLDLLPDEDDAMNAIVGASITYRLAFGPNAGLGVPEERHSPCRLYRPAPTRPNRTNCSAGKARRPRSLFTGNIGDSLPIAWWPASATLSKTGSDSRPSRK